MLIQSKSGYNIKIICIFQHSPVSVGVVLAELGGDYVLIKIGNFECTEVWDCVFYKKLSNYPYITKWEIRNILDFIAYENSHGRECKIDCEDKQVLDSVEKAIQNPTEYKIISRPKLITECTACPYRKGCETEFVCHTT